jgi:hypothetical protein
MLELLMGADAIARSDETLVQARALAADMLAAGARGDLAEIVRRGAGDDFPEVAAAAAALGALADQLRRQDEALRCYADPAFWDDDLPGGPLAWHDKGEMARNVLAGRRPFHHRD